MILRKFGSLLSFGDYGLAVKMPFDTDQQCSVEMEMHTNRSPRAQHSEGEYRLFRDILLSVEKDRKEKS